MPELIDAARKARRARDDETALILLEKAKQVDPARAEAYLERAAIFEARGDDERALYEYRSLHEADPTNWLARLRLLDLEYPRARNLEHAAAVVRDLVWQRRIPEAWFNASRRKLRSESELAHDVALLRQCAFAAGAGGREESPEPVAYIAVAATPAGDTFALNGAEPWLERFGPDGRLVYGVDLWLGEDDMALEVTDVAALPDGGALVAEPRRGRILRFGPGGEYEGALRGDLPAPCAVATSPDGEEIAVLCAGDGTLRRFGTATGRARGCTQFGFKGARMRRGAVAIGRDGVAYVSGAHAIQVVPRRARRPARPIGYPETLKALRAVLPRAGVDVDPRDDTLLVAFPGRGVVVRLDREGREVERICGAGEARLRRPVDVACDGDGGLAVADMDVGILRRSPGAKGLETLFRDPATPPPPEAGPPGGAGRKGRTK